MRSCGSEKENGGMMTGPTERTRNATVKNERSGTMNGINTMKTMDGNQGRARLDHWIARERQLTEKYGLYRPDLLRNNHRIMPRSQIIHPTGRGKRPRPGINPLRRDPVPVKPGSERNLLQHQRLTQKKAHETRKFRKRIYARLYTVYQRRTLLRLLSRWRLL